jgi:hypothetical protein
VKTLGWRTLKNGDATSSQDSTGASIWEWVWKFQPQEGQYNGFSNRRDRKAGTKWTIMKNTTSAITDNARLRLVIYYPDGETQKAIILDETYGTLKNASRYDIQNLITPTMRKVLKPGEYLQLEVNSSETLDISACTFEIGYQMMIGP